MMIGEGFLPWIMEPSDTNPYRHERVQIMRQEWSEPQTVRVLDLPPEMNVADLWWKPVDVNLTTGTKQGTNC